MDWAAISGLVLTLMAMAIRAWKSRELVALRAEVDELEADLEDARHDRRLRRRLRALEAEDEATETEGGEGEDS